MIFKEIRERDFFSDEIFNEFYFVFGVESELDEVGSFFDRSRFWEGIGNDANIVVVFSTSRPATLVF